MNHKDRAALIEKQFPGGEGVAALVRNWFANRCPLLTRFCWKPLKSGKFEMRSITGVTPASRRGRIQYTSTFQFPTSKDDGMKAMFLPGRVKSPYGFIKTIQLQNMLDDAETSLYYQVASPPDGESQWSRMDGLFNIIETYHVRKPTNAACYTFEDFKRDLVSAPAGYCSKPDLLVVASNFLSRQCDWDLPITRETVMQTSFGMPVFLFHSPWLPDVNIMEAPLMQPFNALALRSDEVCVGIKQSPQWRPRENKSNAEGDWFLELAIDLTNEHHHAALSGVTAFAK